MADSNETGHFQIVLGGIGTTLLVLVIAFIFIVWIGGFYRYGNEFLNHGLCLYLCPQRRQNHYTQREQSPCLCPDLLYHWGARRSSLRYNYYHGCRGCVPCSTKSNCSEAYCYRVPRWYAFWFTHHFQDRSHELALGVDILCSDKTGTLTANKLSLNEPYLSPGVDRDWFMTVAVLASSHNVKSLDPIDKVTVVSLKVCSPL